MFGVWYVKITLNRYDFSKATLYSFYTKRDTKHTQKHCPRWRLTRFPSKQEASALHPLCIMPSPLHIYFTIAFCDYIIMEITHKLGKNTLCCS